MEKINLMDFQKRKLKNFYIALYIITKEIRIRTESCITNKKLYVLTGLDIMGSRQVLGVYFDNKNDNRFWLERFEDIQARGVNKVLFFVTPVNKNIERCIKILYNEVQIIHSPDEIYESITRFFAQKPSRKLQIAMKDLFLKGNIDKYKIDLEMFKEIYLDNKIIRIILSEKEKEIEKFYKYNYELRKLLYPYYVIREIYSIELSEETISNMTKAVSEEVKEWQNRKLEKCYPFVYVDCLYCSVKEDLRSIKKLYMWY